MDKLQNGVCTESYEYLIQKFGEEKIISRYEWIYSLMEDFIKIKTPG